MAEPRVLIVISSANRRGAELEGIELAAELSTNGTPASVVALAPSATGVAVDAEIIGDRPLSIGTIRELRRRARSVDVVVAYGSSSLPACAIALLGSGVPFVYRSIGDPGRWVRGRLHRLRTALLFHRARHVVALWPEAALSIVRLYRVLERRVTVIPNARSSDRFRPASATERSDARAALGVSSDERVVVFVGALSEEKRPLLAIEAVMAVDGLLLLVAGDGPLRPECPRGGGTVRWASAMPRVGGRRDAGAACRRCGRVDQSYRGNAGLADRSGVVRGAGGGDRCGCDQPAARASALAAVVCGCLSVGDRCGADRGAHDGCRGPDRPVIHVGASSCPPGRRCSERQPVADRRNQPYSASQLSSIRTAQRR